MIQIFAQNGDAGLTRGIASVIGQEGEQEGWYRLFQGKVPSELPFLTTSALDIAFNALNQTFFVPGSCPNTHTIPVKTFRPLTLLTEAVRPRTGRVRFGFDLYRDVSSQNDVEEKLKLVYVNQQNVPIVQHYGLLVLRGGRLLLRLIFRMSGMK